MWITIKTQIFGVTVTYGNPNSAINITEASYDLDHIGEVNNGISQKEWKCKLKSSDTWIDGMPPASLPRLNQYDIRLRVRDIDSEDGFGEWSDWLIQEFSTSSNYTYPVALFVISPLQVSHGTGTINITDKSYASNSNYSINNYEWKVTRKSNGQLLYNSAVMPGSATLKSWGIGEYDVQLRVRESLVCSIYRDI